ncbi:MAG: hypothetical protein LBS19_04735 [Clostridiales bacterium]|jgi:hypothetical protein|nr:hypothetical protein [Clostridiales bacterium]
MKRFLLLLLLAANIGGCTPAPTQVALIALQDLATAFVFEIMSDRTVRYSYGNAIGLYINEEGTVYGKVTEDGFLTNGAYGTDTMEMSERDYTTLLAMLDAVNGLEASALEPIAATTDTCEVQISLNGKLYTCFYLDYLDPNRRPSVLERHGVPDCPEMLDVAHFLVDTYPDHFEEGRFKTPKMLIEEGVLDEQGNRIQT